jgi:cell wall-associated NlpC family hydrolase
LKYLKKISYLSVCLSFTLLFTASDSFAQDRERLVRTVSSRPVNAPATQTDRTKPLTSSRPTNAPAPRPTLTNDITVIPAEPKSLVKKTGESRSTASMVKGARVSMYAPNVTTSMMGGITSLLGLPYKYGSTGPYRYDCSGFVWQVFNNAGIKFERTSARSLWAMSEPVSGDERYKFGTLVFMNNLGHMGIVADEKGFYHASSSKGITYSLFEGYWEKRIVGFRRLNLPQTEPAAVVPALDAR